MGSVTSPFLGPGGSSVAVGGASVAAVGSSRGLLSRLSGKDSKAPDVNFTRWEQAAEAPTASLAVITW